jgi:hypothetical protein
MTMLNWGRNSDHRTCSSEVFQIFVVNDNVDRSSGTFKIMSPLLESLEDGQEFFIMSVVVKFRGGKSAGVESNRKRKMIDTSSKAATSMAFT